MSQLLTLIWLKWRLLRNSLRSSKAVVNRVASILGMLIALCGCYQGMQVEGNAEEVGLRTTASVVQAIFLVIVLDAVFAVFFSSIGWL